MINVVIGIILGLLITPPLHNIVMGYLEVDTLVFLKTIKLESYIYAAVLTFIFALIMQIVTYYKIKKIDLIDIFAERKEAREAKNWEVADKIRIVLDKVGIILKDSKEGTTWELK